MLLITMTPALLVVFVQIAVTNWLRARTFRDTSAAEVPTKVSQFFLYNK